MDIFLQTASALNDETRVKIIKGTSNNQLSRTLF